MAWTLTDTETGMAVSFSPAAGDIELSVSQPTGVHYPLRSSSPVVLTGIVRYGSLRTPPWLVVGAPDWEAMKTILSAGHRLALVTDVGDTYYCRVNGGYTVTVEDTPTRAVMPRRRVVANLVGVA